MDKVDTSLIASGRSYPPSKKGFNFLHNSYTELFYALAQTVSSNSVTGAYALWGCTKTDLGGGNFSFAEGYIYHAATKEIYYFPHIVSIAIATAPVLTIYTNYDLTYNPVIFSDGSTQYVHKHTYLVVSDGALGSADINYQDLIFVQAPFGTYTPALGIGGGTGSFSASFSQCNYKLTKDFVIISVNLSGITITGAPTSLTITLPPGVTTIGNKQVTGVSNYYDGTTDFSKQVIFPSASLSEKIGVFPKISGAGTFATTSSGALSFSITLLR